MDRCGRFAVLAAVPSRTSGGPPLAASALGRRLATRSPRDRRANRGRSTARPIPCPPEAIAAIDALASACRRSPANFPALRRPARIECAMSRPFLKPPRLRGRGRIVDLLMWLPAAARNAAGDMLRSAADHRGGQAVHIMVAAVLQWPARRLRRAGLPRPRAVGIQGPRRAGRGGFLLLAQPDPDADTWGSTWLVEAGGEATFVTLCAGRGVAARTGLLTCLGSGPVTPVYVSVLWPWSPPGSGRFLGRLGGLPAGRGCCCRRRPRAADAQHPRSGARPGTTARCDWGAATSASAARSPASERPGRGGPPACPPDRPGLRHPSGFRTGRGSGGPAGTLPPGPGAGHGLSLTTSRAPGRDAVRHLPAAVDAHSGVFLAAWLSG